MSQILEALGLSNLFSGSRDKKSKSNTKITSASTSKAKGKKEPIPANIPHNLLEMEASSHPQSPQPKFPTKIFDIDIDSAFPPIVRVESGEVVQNQSCGSDSEISFLVTMDTDTAEEDQDYILDEVEMEEDPGITEIINGGIREFQSDCLGKIDTAFQLQVDQMTRIFSMGLSKAHSAFERQLERELAKIKTDYTNRLLEFKTTTAYYEESKEDISEENRAQDEEMSAGIQALLYQIQQLTQELEIERRTKIQEAEMKLIEKRGQEKLEEDKELLEVTTTATTLHWIQEEEYKMEIQELESELEMAKLENYELEEKIEYERISALAESSRQENIKAMKTRDRNEGLLTLNNLQRKIETLMKQRTDMCYTHQQRITQMIETQSIRADHHNSEFRYFQSILEDARASYKEDLTHFEQSVQIQEEAHDASLEELKNTYRSQVTHLVQSVYALKTSRDLHCAQTASSPQLTEAELSMRNPGTNTPSTITFELSKLHKEVSEGPSGTNQN